jgi:hypothetical protein
MCQKVSCYPLKPLYPSCLQAIPALAWRENRLQSLAIFSYNGARFLDETDKKVFYKQVQVEEGQKKRLLELYANLRRVFTYLSALRIEATKLYLLSKRQWCLMDYGGRSIPMARARRAAYRAARHGETRPRP